jgi:MipA family protein
MRTGVSPVGGSRLVCLCAVSAAAFIAAPARAQSLDEQQLETEALGAKPRPEEWSVTLGAALASVPRYPGADTRRIRLRPLFLVRYENLFFGPIGLGWSAINLGGFHAGPILGYEGGRRASEDPHLTGLGDISQSVTGGAFVRYHVGSFEISATVRQAFTHSGNGLNGLAQLDYRTEIIPHRLVLIAGPKLGFANRQYEQNWFGVTQIQSEQSGLPVFTPGGGVMDVGVHASITYHSTKRILIRAFADLKKLTGDAANSPIVQNRTQTLVGVGAAYHF